MSSAAEMRKLRERVKELEARLAELSPEEAEQPVKLVVTPEELLERWKKEMAELETSASCKAERAYLSALTEHVDQLSRALAAYPRGYEYPSVLWSRSYKDPCIRATYNAEDGSTWKLAATLEEPSDWTVFRIDDGKLENVVAHGRGTLTWDAQRAAEQALGLALRLWKMGERARREA